MLTIGFVILLSFGIISGQPKTSRAIGSPGAQDEVLSYVIDIRTVPKHRGKKSYSKPVIQRKYVVKNRARNYDALARMSVGHEEDDDGYVWTSVEEDTGVSQKAHFVFEPFSTDPNKHAAVFQWIDQMLNGVEGSNSNILEKARSPTQRPSRKLTERPVQSLTRGTTKGTTQRPTQVSAKRVTHRPTQRLADTQAQLPSNRPTQKSTQRPKLRTTADIRRRSGPMAKLKLRKTKPRLQIMRRRSSTRTPNLIANSVPFVSVKSTKPTLLEHKVKAKPVARLVRKAKRTMKNHPQPQPSPPQDEKSGRHYHYELDNGSFSKKELSNGMETQGRYDIKRAGFSSRTVYSVTDGSGFQSESSYSISQSDP